MLKFSVPKAVCQECGDEFVAVTKGQIACSQAHRAAIDKKRYQVLTLSGTLNLPSATAGALAELRAAADLMANGYHVFRALSPACPFDLYVFKDGVSLRVEVKTGAEYHGAIYHTAVRPTQEFDVLATVTPSGVYYSPPLE